MTDGNHNEPTQAVDITQGSPARTWADAKRFLTSAWFVLSDAALATSIAAFSYFGFGLSGPEVALATILSIISAIALVFAFAFVRAPYSQRNEARRELADIQQKLAPRLRVVEPRRSFNTDENLANALIYVEYIRLVVANPSDSIATNCRASVVDVKPKIRYTPTIINGIPFRVTKDFPGYTEIPFPISLRWSDSDAGGTATERSIPPRGQAQVDVMHYTASQEYYPAFSPKLNVKRFELPETEVVFAIRLDSDGCLPYFYVIRYFPTTEVLGPINPLEILYGGPDMSNLKDFREDVPITLPNQVN